MARYRGRGGSEGLTTVIGAIFSVVMLIVGIALGLVWWLGPHSQQQINLKSIEARLQEVSANKSPEQLASSFEIKDLEKRKKEEEQKGTGNDVLIAVSVVLTLIGLGGIVLLIFVI